MKLNNNTSDLSLDTGESKQSLTKKVLAPIAILAFIASMQGCFDGMMTGKFDLDADGDIDACLNEDAACSYSDGTGLQYDTDGTI